MVTPRLFNLAASRLFCWGLVLILAGCGEPLAGLSNQASVVFNVSGSVDGLTTEVLVPDDFVDIARRDVMPTAEQVDIYRRGRTSEEVWVPLNQLRLRVGIMWLGVFDGIPVCNILGPIRQDQRPAAQALFEKACRDPYDAAPAGVTDSVLVASDSDVAMFDIPIFGAPPIVGPTAVFGPANARIGVASIILFVDGDNDGELTFINDRARALDQNFEGMGPASPITPTRERPIDRIYAASMASLDAPHVRLTFLEPGANPVGSFYPAPACAQLARPGYAIWQVDSRVDPSPECAVVAPGGVRLTATSSSVRQLECQHSDGWGFPQPAFNELLQQALSVSTQADRLCLSTDSLFVQVGQACPQPQLYALSGCYGRYTCEQGRVPDWELINRRPEAWPCRGGR